jgi:WhiB family redox-sensing transcriptional regulator
MGEVQSVLQRGLVGTPADHLVGARCRGADAELFFGPSETETRVERMRRENTAKSLCRDCPAVLACRDHALEQGEVYGVWGGLGEQERRMQLIRLGRISASV